MPAKRTMRIYDHRLVRLVQGTGDAAIATRIGVPRSTVAGWTRRAPHPYTIVMPDGTRDLVLEHGLAGLESKFARLRREKLINQQRLDLDEEVYLMAFIAPPLVLRTTVETSV